MSGMGVDNVLRMEIWESPDSEGPDKFGLISGFFLREGDRHGGAVHDSQSESPEVPRVIAGEHLLEQKTFPRAEKAFCTLKHELRALIHKIFRLRFY